ncbi:MAG: family 20 glycosylhydrolase [Flavobacteriales bacterium]|nr:family 20 glycosylhydrolase [Flavobacteriales bacterium]
MRFLPVLLFLAVQAGAQDILQPSIIPAPVKMSIQSGSCDLTCGWVVRGEGASLPGMLSGETADLQQRRPIDCERALVIDLDLFTPDTLLPNEWYSLVVEPGRIHIAAPTVEGLYRGSRTLFQLLEQGSKTGSLPCLSITDWPRFPWRGMHLDVCRHFFPVEFVKKYIDLLARYKMNTFHWHLTEDQGWRIEIKKYPKLTEVGAWRSGSQVGPYSRRAYDSIPYSGFYTQDEIREVVTYAAARHITVVPEIEMPGHAMAALAAYPELGCTGGPYEVQRGWGVFEDVFCAGNDSVFTLLEVVLSEVMDLFPSPYLHIGGDECPKDQWKVCTKCQARMKARELKDEHELQSYFIQRIEKFVNAKGRKIIGWDEILEGGLAPNAAVMSWRGTEGGIAAAKSGHYAVMSPGSHCYFDHYQGDPANEPLAIGGYTTVQKVYSYEPIPAELKPEEAKYILGAQGNVWTEYILTPEHVEYMAVPRMLALAEVLWTPKERRDETDFIARLEEEFPKLEAMKVNASRSSYAPTVQLKSTGLGVVAIEAHANSAGAEVRARMLEGGAKDTFTDWPFNLVWQPMKSNTTVSSSDMQNLTFEVASFRGDEMLGNPLKRTLLFNDATARPITLSVQPNERYNEGGAFTLVDGVTAQEKRVNTEWLGWRQGVTITVDLGSVQDISRISIGALNETHSWIHLPRTVDFYTSSDGIEYTVVGADVAQQLPIGTEAHQGSNEAPQGRKQFEMLGKMKGRYVRFTVEHPGKIPVGFPGAGNPAWLFLDEIEVR